MGQKGNRVSMIRIARSILLQWLVIRGAEKVIFFILFFFGGEHCGGFRMDFWMPFLFDLFRALVSFFLSFLFWRCCVHMLLFDRILCSHRPPLAPPPLEGVGWVQHDDVSSLFFPPSPYPIFLSFGTVGAMSGVPAAYLITSMSVFTCCVGRGSNA